MNLVVAQVSGDICQIVVTLSAVDRSAMFTCRVQFFFCNDSFNDRDILFCYITCVCHSVCDQIHVSMCHIFFKL